MFLLYSMKFKFLGTKDRMWRKSATNVTLSASVAQIYVASRKSREQSEPFWMSEEDKGNS